MTSDDESDSNKNNKSESLRKRIETYFLITGVGEIARRYFVMNAFDGALTTLGIILGSFATGQIEAQLIIGAGLGASIAMAISGFSGAYVTEKAERKKDLQDLEKALLCDLKNTLQEKASNFASIFVAIIDGVAPFMAAFASILPFILSHIGLLSPLIAFYASLMIIMTMLFLLGVFLGRISKVNLYISGLKMVLAGIATALISLLLALI